MKAVAVWARPFDDPVLLSGGRELVTLRDAADYIMKLPKAEQNLDAWQAAVEALLLVVELNADHDGPHWPLRALNRGYVRGFNSSRKDTHWGRHKLKRDT